METIVCLSLFGSSDVRAKSLVRIKHNEADPRGSRDGLDPL